MTSSFSSFPLDRSAYYEEDESLEAAELAYIDSCQKKIAEWTDDNLFTPELILERLTEKTQCEFHHLFQGLRSTFAQATANSSETGLDKASLTTLVTEKIALPSPILQGVGPILFDMLSYTSSFPFVSTTTPTHLNIDGLILGIAILTPSLNPLSRGDEGPDCVVSRSRTEQEARRIVFQALADRGSHVEDKPSITEPRDAPSRCSENFFIDVSGEDPQTTDLLDALVLSQPDQHPCFCNVARSFFKGIAATLLTEQAQHRETLYSLQVSKERFRTLLKVTRAWKAMESRNIPVVVAEVEREAGQLVDEIFNQPGAESVGWNRFDEGVKQFIPDLADDLGELLCSAFGVYEEDPSVRWQSRCMVS